MANVKLYVNITCKCSIETYIGILNIKVKSKLNIKYKC